MGFLDRLLNRPARTAAGPNVASVGVSPRYLGGRETFLMVRAKIAIRGFSPF